MCFNAKHYALIHSLSCQSKRKPKNFQSPRVNVFFSRRLSEGRKGSLKKNVFFQALPKHFCATKLNAFWPFVVVLFALSLFRHSSSDQPLSPLLCSSFDKAQQTSIIRRKDENGSLEGKGWGNLNKPVKDTWTLGPL